MVDAAIQNWGFRELASTGSDPEVFVTADNNLLPAWEFLPSKRSGKVAFWDGFQAEFNTGAYGCIAWVVDSVQAGLRTVLNAARAKQPTAKLTIQNVFQIPVATLRSAADEHVLLGCDPSINAYYMSGKFPGNGRALRYRFAGGHVHMGGFGQLNEDACRELVKALDAVLGVWAVGAAASIDNPIRRQYYGLAGEFRTPKHGLEYRTLSNFWLSHPAITNLVFNLARGVAQFQRAGLMKHWLTHEQETVETINSCDVPRARKILKLNEDVLTHILAGSWNEIAKYFLNSTIVSQAIRVGQNGIESVIKDPDDIEKNWKLDTKHRMKHSDGENENWSRASAYVSMGHQL